MTVERPRRGPRLAADGGRSRPGAPCSARSTTARNGYTPWGTYLTCEENFNGYFVNRSGAVPPLQKRYGINERGLRLPLARARRALRRRPRIPTSRTASAGSSRSTPMTRRASRSSAPRSGRFKHEGATLVARARPPRRRLHGRRRALRVHLQVREPRPVRPRGEPGRELAAARARHPLGGALRRRWRRRVARAEPRQERPRCRRRLPDPGRGADQHPGRGGPRGRDARWTGRSGSPCTRRRGEVYCALTNNTSRGKDGRTRARCRQPAGETTSSATSSGGASGAATPAAARFQWDVFVLGGDPALARRRQARQYQGRRLRLSRRALVRSPRRALDPDRRLDQRAGQGRLRAPRQQPDARRRSRDRRGAALPDRPERLRGHRAWSTTPGRHAACS